MRKLNDITDSVLKYHPQADVEVILNAYMFSAKAHRGQSRTSGEAYLSHPIEVAYNLTRLHMDEKTIAAGLLHDTIEDTLTTPEEIEGVFGEEVYRLVDGVTKIGQVEFASKEEKQAENFRKMILAMAIDIRVVMIKLADRAHNLKTLSALAEDKQKRIARETLDIYAPIANRLGIGWLKMELEDGSFKYLHPKQYKTISKNLNLGAEERKLYVDKVGKELSKELEDSGVEGTVSGRQKHFYSIHKKMIHQNLEFEDVFDLIGLRVITQSVKDCYAILGLVHSLWHPIPGKFKDYIAMPKPNLYQSLHTTVSGPGGHRVEVQIRTEEMHRVSEYGIAAHWQYKEDGGAHMQHLDDHLSWVRRFLEDQEGIKNPKEFLNAFKVDLYFQEVFVFTPLGEVLSLPRGATPVDFAYHVHTDIGHHCQTAKVNGKVVPLRYKLKNGDRVDILTSKQKHPSRDWLSFVKTAKARNKISNFLNSRERERSRDLGREILEKEFERYGLDSVKTLEGESLGEFIHACGFNTLDNLMMSIGYGKTSVARVMEKLVPRSRMEEVAPPKQQVNFKKHRPEESCPIKVKDFDDQMLIRIGKCCHPVPGDPIAGYITRGRGISVHHEKCPGMVSLRHEPDRIVEVEWDHKERELFQAKISIVTIDKPGQLAKISQALAEGDVNITRANVQMGANKRAYFDLDIQIEDLSHLEKTFQLVHKVDGVVYVDRVQEFNKKNTGKGNAKGNSSEDK